MVNNKEVYYLYKISNNIDDSIYIGITNNTKRRFAAHRNDCHNKQLKAAIKLHGIDNFNFEIIKESIRANIEKLEIDTIAKYKAAGSLLYNISEGGSLGNGLSGEKHWNHSLTEKDVLSIRNLYTYSDCTHTTLAEQFNVNRQSISMIIRGETWKHTGGPITKNMNEASRKASNYKFIPSQVVQLREEAKEGFLLLNNIDIPEIAKIHNVSRQNLRKLLKGTNYKDSGGPILGKDYFLNFGRK